MNTLNNLADRPTYVPRRLIQFEGRQIEVPDDASDDEISTILSESPGPQTPQGPQDTSWGSAVSYGSSNALGGLGNTLDVVGERLGTNTGAAAGLKALARSIRPENYRAAGGDLKAFSPSTWGNIPRAVVEAAPGMVANLGAGAVGTAAAGPVGGVAAFMASSAGQNYGNTALEIARNNGRTTPNDSDLAQAAAVTGVEASLDRIGAGGILAKGARGSAGTVASEAGKQTLRAAGREGATEIAQEGVHQAGTTLGTDKGLTIDPEQMANAGLVGGAMGAGLRGARAVPEVTRAGATDFRFRHIDEESGSLAAKALVDTGEDLSSVRRTPDALLKAEASLHQRLTGATGYLKRAGVDGVEASLDPTTGQFGNHSLSEATSFLKKGQTLTQDHLANLEGRELAREI